MSNLSITLVVPFVNKSEFTIRAVKEACRNATGEVKALVIDNGSTEKELTEVVRSLTIASIPFNTVILKKNEGVLSALENSLIFVGTELLMFMHNDVLVLEKGWDTRVAKAFEDDPKLALAGFFGAPLVGVDGGRGYASSNMQGREWGTPWSVHGAHNERVIPASVLDSLCLIFRTSILDELGIPKDWPPHHWFDRLFCLYFIEHGYRVANIGIEFDHAGGTTSTGEIYDSFVEDWSASHGMEPGENADLFMYNYGKSLFEQYSEKLPLMVTSDWEYISQNGRRFNSIES
jgi:hypothetical protein